MSTRQERIEQRLAARVMTVMDQQSKTKQEFRDIQMPANVVRRFRESGDPAVLQQRNAMYQDLAGMPDDFASAMGFVRRAQEAFMELDPLIREQFDNDPGRFLAWYDQQSDEALDELGLLSEDRKRATAARKRKEARASKDAPEGPKGASDSPEGAENGKEDPPAK